MSIANLNRSLISARCEEHFPGPCPAWSHNRTAVARTDPSVEPTPDAMATNNRFGYPV